MHLNSSLSERTPYILGTLTSTHLSTWAKPVSQSAYKHIDSTRGFVSKSSVNKSFPIIRYLCSYIAPNLCFNKKNVCVFYHLLVTFPMHTLTNLYFLASFMVLFYMSISLTSSFGVCVLSCPLRSHFLANVFSQYEHL